jgi:hypothetical protein
VLKESTFDRTFTRIENVLKESTCERTFTRNESENTIEYIMTNLHKAWYHVIRRSGISLKNITDKKCDGTHRDNIKDDFIEITTLLIYTYQGI